MPRTVGANHDLLVRDEVGDREQHLVPTSTRHRNRARGQVDLAVGDDADLLLGDDRNLLQGRRRTRHGDRDVPASIAISNPSNPPERRSRDDRPERVLVDTGLERAVREECSHARSGCHLSRRRPRGHRPQAARLVLLVGGATTGRRRACTFGAEVLAVFESARVASLAARGARWRCEPAMVSGSKYQRQSRSSAHRGDPPVIGTPQSGASGRGRRRQPPGVWRSTWRRPRRRSRSRAASRVASRTRPCASAISVSSR